MKKSSLSDIAKCLNVSPALVSIVLNNRGDEKGISSATQMKVMEKAKELRYKPNMLARGLRLGNSKTIGLIVADISNIFYSKIAKSIEHIAASHGYNLIFCSSDEDPEKEIRLIEMLRERQVDGIIVSTSQHTTSIFNLLKKEKFPFVLIDRPLPRLTGHYVGVDNYAGAFQATEQLIENGHKRIAFLRITPAYLKNINDREAGFKAALRKHKIRLKSGMIREIGFNTIHEDVQRELDNLLQQPDPINAIFTSNNNVAVNCLEYLGSTHYKIPEDVAIISFDDIDLFRFYVPSVTAISQPVEKIGESAVRIILNAIQQPTNGSYEQIVLPTNLIVRQSCGKPRNGNMLSNNEINS